MCLDVFCTRDHLEPAAALGGLLLGGGFRKAALLNSVIDGAASDLLGGGKRSTACCRFIFNKRSIELLKLLNTKLKLQHMLNDAPFRHSGLFHCGSLSMQFLISECIYFLIAILSIYASICTKSDFVQYNISPWLLLLDLMYTSCCALPGSVCTNTSPFLETGFSTLGD